MRAENAQFTLIFEEQFPVYLFKRKNLIISLSRKMARYISIDGYGMKTTKRPLFLQSVLGEQQVDSQEMSVSLSPEGEG